MRLDNGMPERPEVESLLQDSVRSKSADLENEMHGTRFLETASLDTAVLLVGHGTRKASGQAEFRNFYMQFAKCITPVVSEMAFLELANPTIAEAVEQIARRTEIRRLLVVPVLLFTAGHALEDIPSAVKKALRTTCIDFLGQTQALECSPEVLHLSALRFRQAICGEACIETCSRTFCEKASWILVGRGSNSHTAAEKLREFCVLRQTFTPVRQAIAAFIYGQAPCVPEAFQIAANSDSQLVVVQPHLLFTGLLLDELKVQVLEASKLNLGQRWVIAQPLGADLLLAKLVARMARSRIVSEKPDGD